MYILKENRKEADLFAGWYVENKLHLMRLIRRTQTIDEDLLSDIFLSIYVRIMNGIRIKDYTPYVLRAYKYKSIDKSAAAKRLLLVEDYSQLQMIEI